MTTHSRNEVAVKACYFFIFSFMAAQSRFVALYFSEQLNLSDYEVGQILGGSSMLSILFSPAGAYVADEWVGRRQMFCFCIMTSAVLFWTLHLLPKEHNHFVMMLLGVRSIQKMFGAVILPLLDAEVLADLSGESTPEKAKEKWGEARVYGSVGWAVCCLFLGVVFDQFHSTAGIVYVSLTMAFMTSICAMFVFRSSSEISANQSKNNQAEKEVLAEGNKSESITERLAETNHVLFIAKEFSKHFLLSIDGFAFILVVLVSAMAMVLVEAMSFLFFFEDLNMSYTLMGLMVVVTVAMELPLFHYSGKLTEKLGHDLLLLIGLLCYIIRVFIYTVVPADMSYLIVGVEWMHGVTIATVGIARTLKVNDYAPKGYEATFLGILGSIISIGGSIGQFLGGYSFKTFGHRATYRVACLSVLISSFCFMITSPTIKRRLFGAGRPTGTREEYELVSVGDTKTSQPQSISNS